MAAYMRTYRKDHPEKQKEWEKRKTERRRAILTELKNRPCMDCGVEYPYWVMQFDHLENKEFMLSNAGGRGRKKIEEEAAKCDVVCANCHAERTYKRNNPG